MQKKYNHKTIEKKWQKAWNKKGLYKAVDFLDKKKYYILIEFPYPSGKRLHVGHARSYTAMDVLARKKRMQGYNVLFPLGWDAFGLPAENYAIKTGIHPSITTKKNIENSKKQAKSWGLSFDWDREINTADPSYYKWTQWIFLQLYKKGLAYRAEIPVNWCPSCKINLANEEVIDDNNCERCGAEATKKMQKQWMLKITAYADRLLADLETVDYREDIKKQQIEWIGRKQGAIVKFEIQSASWRTKFKINVFTTRIDTIFGATALIIAPDKTINNKFLSLEIASKKQYQKVKEYIKKSQKKSELERVELKEKTGVFTGAYAINPINGEKIPIWVADYVIGWYGKGAIMLVPAHDKRDFEFAKKYEIKIKNVVESFPRRVESISIRKKIKKIFVEDGILVNSGKYTGLTSQEAREKILKEGKDKGWAKKEITYKLRDWVFSRQHYWGEPIPIIYCRKCWEVQSPELKVKNIEGKDYTETNGKKHAIIPVLEKNLPIKLPFVKKYKPTDTGKSPLAAVSSWVNTKCPICNSPAKRETDTMPNWAGSSWYFLRYADPKNKKSLGDKKKLKYWLPIDWYNGGFEHTTLHLLYSRFWYKFLFDLGVVETNEPYMKRTSHGVVLGPDGQKMSKSKGNVINPDKIVEKYGADSFRLYELFMGPFEQMVSWDEGSLKGVRRFLEKVWKLTILKSHASLAGSISGQKEQRAKEQRAINKLIKKVTEDIDKLKFNTAIASMMEYVNKAQSKNWKTFLKLLSPFAPHITEELWQILGEKEFIHFESWPKADLSLIKNKNINLIIQINGKLRGTINIKEQKAKSKNEVERLAKENNKVKKYLKNKKIKKIIFIPGKVINFVV